MRLLHRIAAIIFCFCLSVAWGAPARKPSTKTAAKPAAKKRTPVRSTSTARKSPAKPPAKTAARRASSKTPVRKATRKAPARLSRSSRKRPRPRVVYNPWKEPTYADSTIEDFVDGEDLVVRRAAVQALGPLNGSVVVTDVHSGRVLTIVNQKVAFSDGYTPCSTIKIVVGLAGLQEEVIERESIIKVSRGKLDITDALAKSDNPFFAAVGLRLGFERLSHHARLFGLGERATVNVPEEIPGRLPTEPPSNGGVGMMSSFGEGINLTPLQLSALTAAVANGGTLYYLQYPRSQQEAARMVPRVKRQLGIAPWIEDIKPGMSGAVEYGTARRAGYAHEGTIYGKTGTCTDRRTPTHLGWFTSFNGGASPIAVTVLLTGGQPINGPVASGVAGRVYEVLDTQGYFDLPRQSSPVALVGRSTEVLR